MTRYRTAIAIGAAVVLLAAAAVMLLNRAGFEFGGSCDIPDMAPAGVAGQGELRVIEQGFTQPVDKFKSVSVGALVQNTSDLIAYRTRITIELKDAQNQVITGFEDASDEIPVVLPRQHVGVGMTLSPQQAEAIDKQVTSVEISTQTTTWLPEDGLGDFSPVTAEYRGTARGKNESPETGQIRFVPQSTVCRPLWGANPATVFRNSSGTIVGGMRQYTFVTGACANFGRETWVVPRKALPVADDTRTELYPYCDID